MIKFGAAACAVMALSAPVSANTSTISTTTETVRQAVCVKVTIRNPDGSGSSEESCRTDSSGRT